mgnify:CR=1 FL=1
MPLRESTLAFDVRYTSSRQTLAGHRRDTRLIDMLQMVGGQSAELGLELEGQFDGAGQIRTGLLENADPRTALADLDPVDVRSDRASRTENRDQLGRLGQSRAVGDMDMVHGGAFTQITSGRSSTLPAFQNAALPYSTKRSPSLAKGSSTSKSARGMFMSDRSGPNRSSP